MKIAFYGKLAELIDAELELQLPPAIRTAGDLRGFLAETYPGHAQEFAGQRMKILCGDDFLSDDASISACELIELLPPVSGGSAAAAP